MIGSRGCSERCGVTLGSKPEVSRWIANERANPRRWHFSLLGGRQAGREAGRGTAGVGACVSRIGVVTDVWWIFNSLLTPHWCCICPPLPLTPQASAGAGAGAAPSCVKNNHNKAYQASYWLGPHPWQGLLIFKDLWVIKSLCLLFV